MAVPMSIFQNLPLELLQTIFEHLRRSPSSVYSLSLTCRRVHVATTPLLYSSICLTGPVSSGQLARTLRQSSWLCRLTVELQVHFHDEEMGQSYEPLLTAVFEMRNLKSLSVRSVPLRDIFESTNHRLLDLLRKGENNIEIKSPTEHVGQKLRTLYLGAAYKGFDRGGWLLGANKIVFSMVQLEKLHIQGAKIELLHPGALATSSSVKKTALKYLAFLNRDFSPDTLGQILAFPEALTHLAIKGRWPDPNGSSNSWACDNFVDPCEYVDKIKESSSAGLEYLDFDIWYSESDPDFECLEGLKHLSIPMDAYQYYERGLDGVHELGTRVPIQFLPISLETLELSEFDRTGISFPSILERVKVGQTPNLRAVMYRKFYGMDEEESGEDCEGEIVAFRELGVELSITSCAGPCTMPEYDNWSCECWMFYHTAG
ncbi:hypothetical protein N7519_007907 [Penicillium mononematosum]|uniref:uncharacterized protein n=1 Tax=Penicillium mononematosum TaxID=268346 RepID=UPI002546B7DD|nr:uncharacterized protein N7519_007907 [Penicillium mononematosum]KAJ6186606.1 hypothetical protein N7519_007907 [Penicillium mononematosum]